MAQGQTSIDALFGADVASITESLRAASMDPRPSTAVPANVPKSMPIPTAAQPRPTRQELLYQKARATAGLSSAMSPRLTTIKETQSLDFLPLEGRRGSATDFKPIDWLTKGASILPEAYISSSPVGSPAFPRRTPSQTSMTSFTDPPSGQGNAFFAGTSAPSVPSGFSTHGTMSMDSLTFAMDTDLGMGMGAGGAGGLQFGLPPQAPSLPLGLAGGLPMAGGPILPSPLASNSLINTTTPAPLNSFSLDMWAPRQTPVNNTSVYRTPTTIQSSGFSPYPNARPAPTPSALEAILGSFRQERSMSAPSSPTLSSPAPLRHNGAPLGGAGGMPDNAATGAGNSDVTKRDNICSNCGVTETVLWRLSKLNDRIVCNACGLYENKWRRPRPKELCDGFSPMRRRVRKPRKQTLQSQLQGSAAAHSPQPLSGQSQDQLPMSPSLSSLSGHGSLSQVGAMQPGTSLPAHDMMAPGQQLPMQGMSTDNMFSPQQPRSMSLQQ